MAWVFAMRTARGSLFRRMHYAVSQTNAPALLQAETPFKTEYCRFQLSLWHMHQFSSNVAASSSKRNYQQGVRPTPTPKRAMPRKMHFDTEEVQPSKINDSSPKLSKWQQIRQYGSTGIVIYLSLWFGTYGILYALMHTKHIDITAIAPYIPFAKERIANALSNKLGEATIALIITECAEIFRLPFTLMVTPTIHRFIKRDKKKAN